MTPFTATQRAADLLRQADALLSCSAGNSDSRIRLRAILAPDILWLVDRAAELDADPAHIRRIRALLAG